MSWDDPGVNSPIYVNDQTINVTNWGANVNNPATSRIQSAGFIRGVILRLPPTQFTGPAPTGGQTVGLQPAAQTGLLRMFGRIQVSTQVVNDLLNIRGEDVDILNYLNSGRPGAPANDFRRQYAYASAPQAKNGGNNAANYLSSEAISGQTATLSHYIYLPISQYIVQHNTINVPSGDGKTTVPVRFDRTTEVGFINVQNDRFAMQPRLQLNPLYGPNVDSWLIETSAYAMNAASFSMYLDVDMYPVPDNAADLPPAELLAFVYQRRNTFTDIAVANGGYTYKPDPAGLLCRVAITHYDVNDNFVDLSVNPNALLDLQWGTSVHRYVETLQRNYARAALRYGALPPEGRLIYDFLADDNGGLADSLPPELSNTKLVVSGLPAGVTTARVYEERLIPVTSG